jgi:GxxExxY protein
LLELEVSPSIEALHKAQTLSYLKLTESELGLLMNFGTSSMQYERLPNFMKGANAQVSVAVPENLLYGQESRAILDALHNDHSALGPGFLHQVFRRAVRIELAVPGLAEAYLQELPLRFRTIDIGTKPVRLFLVEGKVMLATISVKQITADHTEKMRWAM